MKRQLIIKTHHKKSAPVRISVLTGLLVTLLAACGETDESIAKAAETQALADTKLCATGMVLEIELDSWKLALEGIADWPIIDGEPQAGMDKAPDYAALLSEMRFAPLPDLAMEERTPERGVLALTSIEIVDLRRGDKAPPDKLVAARFANAAGAQSLRVQVLRPLSRRNKAKFCALGTDFSHEKESGEEPCIEAYAGPARSLQPIKLVAPDRDAIKVSDASGWCGVGDRRGDKFSTAYWGVEDGRLARYLEAVTFESWYQSPYPPTKQLRSEIRLSDAWPKSISVTETMECLFEDLSAEPNEECQPYQKRFSYQYVDNRYVEQRVEQNDVQKISTEAMNAIDSKPKEVTP